MLRVAVPNKGSLNTPAVQLLSDAGYRVHREHKALFATDAANDVQFVFLRPTDIARTVGSGVLDVGITGQDLLRAAGHPVCGLPTAQRRLAAPRLAAASELVLSGSMVYMFLAML